MLKTYPCGCQVRCPGETEDASRRVAARFCALHMSPGIAGVIEYALSGRSTEEITRALATFVDLGYIAQDEADTILHKLTTQ